MDPTSQLRSALQSQNLPTPSHAFLAQIVTARNPPPPLPSLLATAKARLLACDLTSSSSLSSSSSSSSSSSASSSPPCPIIDPSSPCFPPDIDNVAAREARLPHDVHVQVLDVENLSASLMEQVEELEAVQRGETTRGRQVIRVTATADDDNEHSQTQTQTQQRPGQRTTPAAAAAAATPFASANLTHRLSLQDRQGKRVYAVEVARIPRIGVGKTMIGEKLLIRANARLARGVLMLAPDTCVLLGGKVDAWHEAWVEGRLAKLKEGLSDRPTS